MPFFYYGHYLLFSLGACGSFSSLSTVEVFFFFPQIMRITVFAFGHMVE